MMPTSAPPRHGFTLARAISWLKPINASDSRNEKSTRISTPKILPAGMDQLLIRFCNLIRLERIPREAEVLGELSGRVFCGAARTVAPMRQPRSGGRLQP